MESHSNNRLVKNTLLLYVRTIIVMCVGLYTSRVILDVLGIEDYGIYVNNCFRNMIDFKPNDILTIRLCGNILNCKVAEVYTDVKTNDMIGFTFATCKEIDRLYIKNEDVSLKYAIAGNTSDTILAEILFEDSNAYIDKNQRLSGYLKEFIAAQKYILLNYCLIIAFSSILLVLLGQMILFIKKGEKFKK